MDELELKTRVGCFFSMLNNQNECKSHLYSVLNTHEGSMMKNKNIDKRSVPRFSFIKVITRLMGLIISGLLLSLFLQTPAHAHRGAKNAIDLCRFTVGNEVIHFSAYTPNITGGESFCRTIPGIGLTHLVFDYEGNKLRKTTVEFEITKEPEGTRVFYQKPEKIKKGSVDAEINFDKLGLGSGNYLAHVTIMYQGDKLDSHLPFTVGMEPEDSINYIVIIAGVILAIIGIFVFVTMLRRFEANKTAEYRED